MRAPTTTALPLLSLLALSALAMSAPAPAPHAKLALDAISSDPKQAEAACAALRELGPEGLDALFEAHAAAIARGLTDDAWPRLRLALDRVAAQHDAHASHLYWYTDLAAAKAAALRLGRPILSLRLLGNLDDDLSCANSRLFRSVLYADPAVSRLLRERFVLHWSSERPAPRITIDYGDGRVLVRTITGNSVHYVLDPNGRVVDALPGMWGPQGFAAALNEAASLEARLRPLTDVQEFAIERGRTYTLRPESERAEAAMLMRDRERPARVPTARAAANRTESKLNMQLLAIAALEGGRPGGPAGLVGPRALDPAVEAIIARERPTVVLSSATRALLRDKEGPGSGAPGAGQAGEPAAEARFTARLARLEDSIARDQALDRIALRPQIQAWIGEDSSAQLEWAELNRRVYAEAFLTPADDPWMGLIDADAFTGQDRGGLAPR
jgi:hypothetical protein